VLRNSYRKYAGRPTEVSIARRSTKSDLPNEKFRAHDFKRNILRTINDLILHLYPKFRPQGGARRIVVKQLRYLLIGICLGLTAFGGAQSIPGQQSGTLVFDLKNYTSDAKMPKNAVKALQHAGFRWGVLDKNLLIPMANEKFVKADIPYFTHFGEQKTLALESGQYTITCIGFEFSSTSSDPDKFLSKAGFFNNDVITFTVLPGKTTTLEISPVYEAESQWRVLAKLTLLVPDLKVRVLEDGTPKGEDVVISRRTAKSVAWDDYHGPLKF
jgi:hypothetical protein